MGQLYSPTLLQGKAPQYDTRAFLSSVNGFRDSLKDYRNTLALERRQKRLDEQTAIQNKRADAMLQLRQQAGARQQGEYDAKMASIQAMKDVSQGFANNPSAEVYGTRTPEMDQKVLNNLDKLTPSSKHVTSGGEPIPMSPADKELYDRQAKLQALYETQKPSQEQAYGAIMSQLLAKGADPTKAPIVAKNMVLGLDSEVTQKASDEAAAKEYNDRQDTLFKEANKLYIANNKLLNKSSGTTSSKTKKDRNDILQALTKISPSEFIGKDRKDAYTAYKNAYNIAVEAGLTQSQANALTADAMKYASGNTDWTDGKTIEFNKPMFETFVRDNQNNYKNNSQLNISGNSNSNNGTTVLTKRPNAPKYITGSTIGENRESDRLKSVNTRMNEILGINTVNNNNRNETPKVKKPENPKKQVKKDIVAITEAEKKAADALPAILEANKELMDKKFKQYQEDSKKAEKIKKNGYYDGMSVDDFVKRTRGSIEDFYEQKLDYEKRLKEAKAKDRKNTLLNLNPLRGATTFPKLRTDYESTMLKDNDAKALALKAYKADRLLESQSEAILLDEANKEAKNALTLPKPPDIVNVRNALTPRESMLSDAEMAKYLKGKSRREARNAIITLYMKHNPNEMLSSEDYREVNRIMKSIYSPNK